MSYPWAGNYCRSPKMSLTLEVGWIEEGDDVSMTILVGATGT